MSSSSVIKFYNPNDSYYEFSNFYKHPLNINGREWSSVEHFYQASKFYIPQSLRHMEYYNLIHSADSPTKVFMLGTQKKKYGYAVKWTVNKKDKRTINSVIDLYNDIHIRDDWEDVKLSIMKQALTEKFKNHRLSTLLTETHDAQIIEDSPRDSFWGIGKDGKGANYLGRLLMDVRAELTSKAL